MNPDEWEYIQQRHRRDLDPKRWTDTEEMSRNVSRTDIERDPYCSYSRYTLKEPHASMERTDTEWKHHIPFSHRRYNLGSAAFTSDRDPDPDGDPIDMSEEDQELDRKRKELQEIEEQIILKKASLALKKVEPFLKSETLYPTLKEEHEPNLSYSKADISTKKDEHFLQFTEENEAGYSQSKRSTAYDYRRDHKGAALKERVNVILQQRQPLGFPSKSPKVANSFAERISSSSTSKDGLWQEDHPLKLRVRALMRQRHSSPQALQPNGQVPDVKPQPPSQSPASPVLEQNTVSKGFERFLSVLNKGVDINLLAKIVNDDSEDLPVGGNLLLMQPPVLENKSNVPSRSESQGSHSGALLRDHSRSSSRERRTELLSQEGSHKERRSLPSEESVQMNDSGDGHFRSGSRSRSPQVVVVEEERKTKVDEQHGHLQNILKTLGLSLDEDELSRLADRTQERLYGKKNEDGQREDQTGERKRHQDSSPRPHTSASTSGISPGSPLHRRSPGKDSRDSRERRQTSEYSRSREKSGDKEGDQGQDEDRDMDGANSKESSPDYRPYPENPAYPCHDPAAVSVLPEFNSAQYSQNTAYHSDTYNDSSPTFWAFTPGAAPPSPYLYGHPYPQNPSYHFTGSAESPGAGYHDPWCADNSDFMLNPDMSESEGQRGQLLSPRCLQVIKTHESKGNQRCLMEVTTHSQTNNKRKGRQQYWRRKRRRALREQAMPSTQGVEAPEALLNTNTETQQSGEAKESQKPLTEEEIKANLKKRLEAFNQKMKRNVTKPAETSA
ncbi:uncharacterized protein ACJ7VT_012928 [Polymixia lowei]